MTPTILNAALHPMTSFAGSAGHGFVAAVGAASVSVCVCCIPYLDVSPLTRWATSTAPAAEQAVTQSAHDGSAEAQREVRRSPAGPAVHPSVRLVVPRATLPVVPRRVAPLAHAILTTAHQVVVPGVPTSTVGRALAR